MFPPDSVLCFLFFSRFRVVPPFWSPLLLASFLSPTLIFSIFLLRSQEAKKAATHARKLLSQADEEAEFWSFFRQGITNLAAGDVLPALKAATKAINTDPRRREFWELRCDLFLELQDYEAALADCDTLLKTPFTERAVPPPSFSSLHARELFPRHDDLVVSSPPGEVICSFSK